MNINYIINNYNIEKLTNEHDLSGFKSSSEDLNDYLKNYALKDQKNNLNVTHLIVCDSEIIGFFSLLNDSVEIRRLEKDEQKMFKEKTSNSKLPSMKIGRLAIDKKYEGKGLGTFFLGVILSIINKLANEKTGIRFITVDGYAKAFNFYKKYDFKHFKSNEKDIKKINKVIRTHPNKQIPLYLDIKVII